MTSAFGLPVVALKAQGYRKTSCSEGEYITPLYREYKKELKEEQKIRLIPYRLWANRGEGEMSVFIGL